MRRILFAGLSGVLFGAGLVVSGMSNPHKVLNFLDLLGPWDASLLVVMAVAVTVTVIGFRLAWKQGKPMCGGEFLNPSNTGIDRNLLLGAALFGVGWGLAGYCPGPALTALVINPREAVLFVAAMFAGGYLFSMQSRSA